MKTMKAVVFKARTGCSVISVMAFWVALHPELPVTGRGVQLAGVGANHA
jgi:hypothetical protein